MEAVAVLGGGTMGGGIAGQLARAGLDVRLADASAELAERARETLLERTRGRGFAEYSDEERERLLLERDRRYAALARLLDEE